MKKLVVVAAIALTAVCSQAASMKWTMSADASDAGLKVYLVSALSEFTDEASVQSSVIGTGGNSGTITTGRTTGAGGTVVGLEAAAPGETKMQDFYYVIVSDDGKGYWASGKQSAQVYTTETTHQDSNIAASSFKTGSYTAWSTGGGGGGGGTDPLPEPTSGLLLLVGGAVLALRRKQK